MFEEFSDFINLLNKQKTHKRDMHKPLISFYLKKNLKRKKRKVISALVPVFDFFFFNFFSEIIIDAWNILDFIAIRSGDKRSIYKFCH